MQFGLMRLIKQIMLSQRHLRTGCAPALHPASYLLYTFYVQAASTWARWVVQYVEKSTMLLINSNNEYNIIYLYHYVKEISELGTV